MSSHCLTFRSRYPRRPHQSRPLYALAGYRRVDEIQFRSSYLSYCFS
ncbi:Uncharacterised protein [Vibrio cholerae]|nr:Uncharacterised protein [Vibrio cholerae]